MARLSKRLLLLIAVEEAELLTQSGDLIVSQGDQHLYGPRYGFDELPVGTDAMLVNRFSITPQKSNVVSRKLVRPYFGASWQFVTNTRVQCKFTVELAGSGTAGIAPQYGRALRACGLRETVVANTSVTYAPVSEFFDSATIYCNLDGVLHKMTGCRGTFTLNLSAGRVPTIEFTFTGIYNAPEDSAFPAVNYSNQAKPLIANSDNTDTFEFLSYSACLESVSMDLGNELLYRELVGCDNRVLITDRRATGTVVIDATRPDDKDYFSAVLESSVLGNLTFRHGDTAGNIVSFASTGISAGAVSYSEQDGIVKLQVPYVATPSTAGNDEFSLVYT